MTIPTAEQFSAWLALAAEIPRAYSGLPSPPPINITKELGTAYVIEAQRQLDVALAKLRELPADAWLQEQREFKRALERLRGRKGGKQRPEESIEEFASRYVEQRYAVAASAEDPAQAFRLDVLRYYEQPYKHRPLGRWKYEVVNAFREYFYAAADSPALLLEAARAIGPAAKQLQSALGEYLAIARTLEAVGLPGTRIHGLRTLQRGLESVTPSVYFPLSRVDGTARERLLVFRIWFANRGLTGRPKTEAIIELMGIEGIQHQYDARTLERMCAGFADSIRAYRAQRLPG
ncbi:hypothetical protein [Piscinibacter koreensis]|uniref:Uncharacterized protein n=1 Tax=Piscinibacter koreensis TaxID=2742824 RepID=A0A7Y6NQT4_9BURK|nr:hypothetical protein [Schlegelella koreensis]NUZ07599.1 hypothetical protein [Schlegelella koreensis]